MPDAGGAEAPVPLVALAEPARDERPEEGAEVDPHVEDRERRRRVGRPPSGYRSPTIVETFGLRSPVPQMMKKRPMKKVVVRRNRHREVPEGDHPTADPDRLALPPQVVGHPATRKRHDVHERRVEPVDRAPAVGASKPSPGIRLDGRRGHEERQKRPHAVVGEALPHLREEERREAARMSEERLAAGRTGGGRHLGRHGGVALRVRESERGGWRSRRLGNREWSIRTQVGTLLLFFRRSVATHGSQLLLITERRQGTAWDTHAPR